MTPPMVGHWTVDVESVRPYSIHGDVYYEMTVTLAPPESGEAIVRVPQHAAKTPPRPGERLVLTFLMGQVTKVELAQA